MMSVIGDVSTTNHGIGCGGDNPTNLFAAKPYYQLALGGWLAERSRVQTTTLTSVIAGGLMIDVGEV